MIEDNTPVGWQPNLHRRGTPTIIVDCFFTILACTWSIQHLNVPNPRDKFWTRLGRKCKWAVFSVLLPEFLMAHAVLELSMGINDLWSIFLKSRDWHTNGMGESVENWVVSLPWWLPYPPKGSLAGDEPVDSADNQYPGLFRVLRQNRFQRNKSHTDEEAVSPEEGQGQDVTTNRMKWTLTHCYFANMGGFYLGDPAHLIEHDSFRPLTAQNFVENWGSIQVPRYSEADLKDKGKADLFAKFIAVLQIGKLCLSLLVRRIRHLAYSQFETLTLAFAICGILIYICRWYKPQGVERPFEVKAKSTPAAISGLQQKTFDSLWAVVSDSRGESGIKAQMPNRIPNDNIPEHRDSEVHHAMYVLAVLTAGYGSLHTLAWNFEFPTFVELQLWRWSTIVSAAVPPIALLAIPLSQQLRHWGNSREFMRGCLRVLSEFSYHYPLDEEVQPAIDKLDGVYNRQPDEDDKTPYRDIFGGGEQGFLGKRLLDFLKLEMDAGGTPTAEKQDRAGRGGLHSELLGRSSDFLRQFEDLVDILGNTIRSNKRAVRARTNMYPEKPWVDRKVNHGIIFTSSVLYFLARLCLIGVACSSLRRMPDSVYITTWVRNVPSLQ